MKWIKELVRGGLSIGILSLLLVLVSGGALLAQEGDTEDGTGDVEEESTFTSPGEAQRIANLVEAEANQPNPELDAALAELEEAQAASGALEGSEDQEAIDAALSELTAAQETVDGIVTETTGVTAEDIEAMRDEGMGFGEIALELGLHPGVLGQGLQKGHLGPPPGVIDEQDIELAAGEEELGDLDDPEDPEDPDQDLDPAFTSPAEAQRIANLVEAVANQPSPELEAAMAELEAAQAAFDALEGSTDDSAIGAALAELEAAQATVGGLMEDASGVTAEDIEAMRAEDMGWGDIAHELGLHPSVLGFGPKQARGLAPEEDQQGFDASMQAEIEEATARSARTGLSRGHGLSRGRGAASTGSEGGPGPQAARAGAGSAAGKGPGGPGAGAAGQGNGGGPGGGPGAAAGGPGNGNGPGGSGNGPGNGPGGPGGNAGGPGGGPGGTTGGPGGGPGGNAGGPGGGPGGPGGSPGGLGGGPGGNGNAGDNGNAGGNGGRP